MSIAKIKFPIKLNGGETPTTCIAFYKKELRTIPWKDRWLDLIIRVFSTSPYSHCEIARLKDKDFKEYTCISSSTRDGYNGVRKLDLYLNGDDWDLIRIDDAYWEMALKFFEINKKARYDYFGAIYSATGLFKQSEKKWFCSEFVAAILGFKHPEKLNPGELFEKIIYPNPEDTDNPMRENKK